MTVSIDRTRNPQPLWDALKADAQLVALDALIVASAYIVALVLRFDGLVPTDYWRNLPIFACVAIIVYLALHVGMGLYGRVWLQASSAEAWQLVIASVTATGIMVCLVLATAPVHVVPLSVPVNGGALALLLLGGLRFHSRVLAGRAARRAVVQLGVGTRVILAGSAAAVRGVLSQMRSEPGAGFVPVAIVTDDQRTWGRTLGGIPVHGSVDKLVDAMRCHVAEQVLLVPGGAKDEALRVADLAREGGFKVRVLPSLNDAWDHRPRLRDVRDLSIEDLLGREPVEIDSAAVRGTVEGRVVLVTGAGGSIGREIAAQVSRLAPSRLILLDHDETHLHDAMALLVDMATAVPVLGDIRDGSFVCRFFAQHRPEVVFHAAAHKHVPILETFPSEAVRTNILGTDVLLRAAVRYGTETFVAISTDKAVAPTSVMGASKRLAEQLVVHRRPAGMRYCAVRFGNVLGSRGSVVPTFLRQVQQGGPVTVTHPEMTRFFMTTREAVHLVMEAASRSEGGEVFMLDMGTPVRIVDLARRIITLSGETPDDGVSIEYTGLRPGEKLNEQLYSSTETASATSHPKIMLVRGPRPPSDLLVSGVERLVELADAQDEDAVRHLLFELAQLPYVVELDGEVLAAARSVRHSDAAQAGSVKWFSS